MPPITKNSIVTVTKEQVSCDLAGETAILDLKSGEYYGLNPVGARVWELVQKSRAVNEVIDILLNEYDVQANDCERDVFLLLNDLQGKGLLEVTDANV